MGKGAELCIGVRYCPVCLLFSRQPDDNMGKMSIIINIEENDLKFIISSIFWSDLASDRL